jgi:hypothetical protein
MGPTEQRTRKGGGILGTVENVTAVGEMVDQGFRSLEPSELVVNEYE